MKPDADAFRLTDFRGIPDRVIPSLDQKPEKFKARTEPLAAWKYLPQGVDGGLFVGNRLATSGLVTAGLAEAGLVKDRRWASKFNHGDRETANNCGCRC